MSINREKLVQKFQEEYEKLNNEQKRAVDSIEGPVMVIAGPGTGKTQILASRIGKILLETDSLPQNILCLTYTEAGVVAMRKRLLHFIGPDAYKVNIHTFHAFCNDVVQENLSLFDKTALDPISDLEKIELLKQLIDSFPKNHPLKRYRGDVYYEINNLQSLFSTMKQEGWTPAFVNQKIDEYIANLSTKDEFIYKKKHKEFNAGDLKKDRIEEAIEKMERLRSAVNEFDNFQQMMRKKNRYDFDDMINWVLKAFDENKNLLARYQEQFLYILVDEYQDTNGAQNKLIDLLISFWERPNVFVVGDDDQSIYRFQGANVENMLQFADSYKKDLKTVVLTSNYRSTQPILDISKTLINCNEERLIKQIPDLRKDLHSAKRPASTTSAWPHIKEYETQRQEMIDIVMQVQKLINDGTPAGSIGIIYRENKYGEGLAQYFRVLNIPVYSKRNQNILDLPLAQKIITVCKWIAAEHEIAYSGDELLFEILHFDWFGIPPIEIAKLSIEVADRQFAENKISLRQLLYEKAIAKPKDLFSQGIHEGLKKASAALEKLMADAPNVTLQILFENIILCAGVLSHIMQSPEKYWLLQVLTGLFDFVKEETRRNPVLSLHELVSIIQLMQDEDLHLPLIQVSGSDKGVNLLTAHGSKGLEFEHVFFAGCNSYLWEKKRKPGGGYRFPDTIFTSPSFGGGQGDVEELRRLFYVAITRARQHLTISYSKFRMDGRELEPSMFIAEILNQHDIPVETPFISEETLAGFTALQFGQTEAPEIERMEEEWISRMLERFVMNVTALNNFLKCPLEFYFNNLVRIPRPRNEATEFGSAVHYALEQLFRKMQNNQEKFPSPSEFIGDFDWHMRRHRESFTREQFERRMEYGHDVLNNYYAEYIEKFNKIVTIERKIRNVTVKGVPIKGKMDKLEFTGKQVNVVDYKTGDPEKSVGKLKGPSDKDPNGGNYWRQAVFYKILIDHYGAKDWQVISTEFDFVEPDKKKKYQKRKITITPEDMATVTEQISETWQKIQNREFHIGCGKEDCHWCNFVKTNNMAVALHEIGEEEPEDY